MGLDVLLDYSVRQGRLYDKAESTKVQDEVEYFLFSFLDFFFYSRKPYSFVYTSIDST